jgi:hypothetical protein
MLSAAEVTRVINNFRGLGLGQGSAVSSEEIKLFALFGFGEAQVKAMSQADVDTNMKRILTVSVPALIGKIERGESKTSLNYLTTTANEAEAAYIQRTSPVAPPIVEPEVEPPPAVAPPTMAPAKAMMFPGVGKIPNWMLVVGVIISGFLLWSKYKETKGAG